MRNRGEQIEAGGIAVRVSLTAEQEAEIGRDLWAIDHPFVYLACPYSHPDRDVRVARFEAANKAASALMRQGMKVFSPISHTHPIAEAGELPLGWDFWNEYDRAFIERSCKVIVLRVDGWRESTGVNAEVAIADELHIPVEFADP